MFLSSSSTSSADEGEATATPSQNLEYETVTRLRLKTKSSPLSTDVKRKVKNSTKKEESLFSLKQFLKNDNHTNHQFTGARPKIYEPHLRTSKSNENNETGNYPRNPTELPDFVQDHLVIEQCYLSDKVSTNTGNLEADNLPDFALNSVKKKHTQNLNGQWNNASTDITFDLTDNLHKDSAINSSLQNCLHLPKLDVIDGESADIPECSGFPFDIQIPRGAESNSNSSVTINNSLSHEIHDTSKLLPDFLSEAPIRSRGIPLSDRSNCSRSSDSINQWLIMENERLQNELQSTRRQANEHLIRMQTLEAEVLSRRQSDHIENANNEKALQEVEDNLKRSTKRAINAENRIVSLKKDIDSLSLEIMKLQTENRELKMAMKVESSGYRTLIPNRRIQGLADNLRLSASTAEVSLKQLISDVNNLRILASALEKIDKTEDSTKDFLSDDLDEDNATGPAL